MIVLAVRIRDKALMAVERLGIDLRDHQRHAVVHPVVIAIVDHHRATLDRLPAELLGRAFGALGAGEEHDVQTVERFGLGLQHMERLARDLFVALARG